LGARVESADALSPTNILKLDMTGVAIISLCYLDASSPAHMRYSVRRLRRKLPKIPIMLGCWAENIDKQSLDELREVAKADTAAGSLREAMMICRTSAGVQELDEHPQQLATAVRNA
jgi:tRNA A37 methylthiotransferase MiaB